MQVVDLLIVAPPVGNIGQAPAGISVLTAFLRSRGWDTHQRDLGIEAFHHFHSPRFLDGCRRRLEATGCDLELSAVATRVVRDIDAAKDALRRPGIERQRETMRWAFGTLRDAGIVMTAAAGGTHEHTLRNFSIRGALRDFQSLDRCLGDTPTNPYVAYFREHTIAAITALEPRALGISITYFSQLIPGLTLLRLIKSAMPELPVALGGAYLTAVESEIASIPTAVVPADLIATHDGEWILDRWLANLGGEAWADQPHAYRPAHGRFSRSAGCSASSTSLDDLPAPMWVADGLALEDYLVPTYPIPLPLSRGCYWGRCAYCNISSQTQSSYRVRNTESAIVDIRAAMAETGSRSFDFPVDSFRVKDLLALSKAIIAAGLEVRWGAEVLLDNGFQDDVVETLARSGCRSLRFGLESACAATLDAMNKPVRSATARRILGACRANGIRTAAMLIAGFPCETQGQLLETYDFLVENRDRIDSLTIHEFSLVPGSTMADDPGRFGILVRPKETILSPNLPFANANAVGMRVEDVPSVVAAMLERLREHYPELGEMWSVAIGGWMTFVACCDDAEP